MIADQPFVSYKSDKEKKKTKKSMDDLADRWAAAHKKTNKIENPLDSFKGGKKTTIGDFFSNKTK